MGRHGTIANRKEKQDAKRAQMFTKYARLITVAAREGGADPEYNAALKNAIDKAKAINMPNDNINRAIKKGAGGTDGDNFERITYEGYGPNGIAVIVEALTDNRNRTGSNLRYYFDKNGGNLGTTGCVGYMFDRKGQILIEKKDEYQEDELMEAALEAGAEDFVTDDEEVYEIFTAPQDFYDVKNELQEKGYEFIEADIAMIPQTTTKLENEEQIKAMNKLIDMLEDDDDIQQIYHNWDMPEK
ncbi:YebC/PmpR family DNA-binding transcriptional regulator [Crassaminicella thermophila]|uniref:Probable transcriptional regulatory protein FQB35_05650 n=1 Tax=Crassaminicella thermophila TaxID=2599308 RepID=A0A5C0SF15_CRATE|nr:YebC/PmpR family DNA-binding transcriptional regulator [Crassaminicella thermophila]QEK11894.1 YebC/PmpR family DNA-binding transcriptional regulator [Crassaminicella thermophila]